MSRIGKEFTLRKVKDEDFKTMLELHNICNPDWKISSQSMEYWKKHGFHKERSGGVVVFLKDKLIGFGTYRVHPGVAPYSPEELDINILVHPDFRRRGIGSTILKWLEDEVKRQFKVKRLTTGTMCEEGVKFLESHGFKETFREKIAFINLNEINLASLPDYKNHLFQRGITIVSFDKALMWKEPADPVPYINPVGMLPPYQVEDIKYKLAYALIVEAIKYAKKRGYKNIKTWYTGNIAGIEKIYNTLGFKNRYFCVNFVKELK